MLDFGFYNMDCMDGMKEFPDNYFDLAIVDPPYGDAGGGWKTGERFGERFDRYKKFSEGGGRTALNFRIAEEKQKLREPAEHGRRNSEKNHRVGRRPETGIF
jgi:DNA modification methylase